MGKGTDKLYITHSEWSSGDHYSASAGSNKGSIPGVNFRRLPFNFCAISLQPFENPVCTNDGTVFDLLNILPWLKKHGTNPVNRQPLSRAELHKLNFSKNDEGEYVDPVTYKPLTNHSHIVAIKTTGNVFTWDTVNEFNIKAKNWKDLVSEEPFVRQDLITLQDPQHLSSRDLSSFQYLKDGVSVLTDEQQRERSDPSANINPAASSADAKLQKAKEAIAKNRAKRDAETSAAAAKSLTASRNPTAKASTATRLAPYNAALHTNGQAAASFTSTGITPHTSGERALMSEEEYMLKPRRVKNKGYARIQTSRGDINVELYPEYSPKAVWNFVQLSKQGYYKGVEFHRSIKNFMLQGGDPTGTGRGGQSIWGRPFEDEWGQSPLKHDTRGTLSMANKGKNTNTSQFFLTYRPTPFLDRKHTIFGRMIDNDPGQESERTLSALEGVETGDKDRPVEPVEIEEIVIFVDPFEEFQKNRDEKEELEQEKREIARSGGTEDDTTTWTGKRLGLDGKIQVQLEDSQVGKYLEAAMAKRNAADDEDDILEMDDEPVYEPPTKKRKGGQFNFDNW